MAKKILFITLSNIGDAILTLPALDYLRQGNPGARITVMAGARPAELFRDNPNIDKFIIYDKRANLRENIRLFNALKKEKFDMVIDLRNTFFGACLPGAKFRMPPILMVPKGIKHMKDRHLYKVASGITCGAAKSLYVREEDKQYIDNLLKVNNITQEDNIIVIAAGARSHIKRWPQEKFAQLIPILIEEFKAKVILVGDKDDAPINKYITAMCSTPAHPIGLGATAVGGTPADPAAEGGVPTNRYGGVGIRPGVTATGAVLDLSGRTTIAQLAYLLEKARLLITNDSAVLHLASYLNISVVAVFGPTNELKYGPWSDNCSIVKKDIACRPCEKAQCKSGDLKCMHLIKVEDVLRKIRNLLVPNLKLPTPCLAGRQANSPLQIPDYKRILIVRTDRIGDVILSTPVIKAMRESYPDAYIAMMVNPYAKDIVDGNPYLDKVIIYDKEGKHKSWFRSVKFALNLKKKRFDLALILHPTNPVHLVAFFAGIPKRVGYDRKLGILLTDRIKHIKQLGEKHESEYNLDLVRYLGIEPKDKDLFIPIKPESEKWVEDLFRQEGINKSDKLLAIHPVASCISRIWPSERFAQLADRLIERYGFKVLIIAGPNPEHIKISKDLIAKMRCRALNLAGKTSVSQLASLLKRCRLHISSDTGPMHIASGVGIPVVVIFGRRQEGLSPRRWGPVGTKSRVLHKDVGCIKCLAHNCVKEFMCLKAISVDDVICAAGSLIKDTI